MQFPECRQLNANQEDEVMDLIRLNVSASHICNFILQKYQIPLKDYDIYNKKKKMKNVSGLNEESRIRSVFMDVLRIDPGILMLVLCGKTWPGLKGGSV